MYAVGTKNNSAAKIHKLMEDCPLRAAAAIHRGPSTVAMQNSNTSQNPITRGNCCFALETVEDVSLTKSHPVRVMSWSCRRKLRRYGSGAATNPSQRAEIGDATFVKEHDTVGEFFRQMRVVGYDDGCFGNFPLESKDQVAGVQAIRGSTIVVGSSYRIASGSCASARAMATARFIPC